MFCFFVFFKISYEDVLIKNEMLIVMSNVQGHVGIARYDEVDFNGWKVLGIPTGMKKQNGEVLDMNALLSDHLKTGDHVIIYTVILIYYNLISIVLFVDQIFLNSFLHFYI